MSANYVEMLQASEPTEGTRYLNAGVNGDLAFNVLARLDEIVACQPDVVTIMVGTNDVSARISDEYLRGYQRNKGLRETPTLAWYLDQLREIVRRLRAETSARIALLDLPPLLEDPSAPIHLLAREYAQAARALARELGVTWLPVYDEMMRLIPAGHRPPEYADNKRLMSRVKWRRRLFRTSYQRLAERNGMAIVTDFVHLTEPAAAIIATRIRDFVHHPDHYAV